jgi:CheY-like chemotaxis protein
MELKKIAIVDDHDSFRRTIKDVFSLLGNIEVTEASSGFEYLKLLDNYSPDVTFMDIQMPGMSGIETTIKALQKNPDLTIIGLSLFANDEYVDQLIEAGAKGYLLKLSNNYNLFKSIINNPKAEVFFSEKIKKRLDEKSEKDVKTILVVDDFETNTIVIENSLTSLGYKVLVAKSTLEGFKYALDEKITIDLIITDYNMPNKSGIEMIKDIRMIPGYSKIPSLILSSDDNEDKKIFAKEAGVVGWLKKPFILSKFLSIVDSVF